jgi:hypothetical protein
MRTPTTVALFALLVLSSCRGNQARTDSRPAPAGQATYHNPDAELRLTYPTTWTKLEHGQQGTRALVAFLAPAYEKGDWQHLAFDVRKLSQDQPASIEEFKDAAIAEAKTVFPRFELISSKSTTLGGKEAFRIVYTAGTERGTARIMQVLALAGGNAYSATYTSRRQQGFQRSLPDVEQILASVQIE